MTSLERFADLLQKHIGLQLSAHERTRAEGALTRLASLHACDDTDMLLGVLERLPADAALWQAVANEITVGESYFFRDVKQLELLANELLPALLSRKLPGERVRILSAGCSSGEEIVSIGIILSQLLKESPGPEYDLVGIDISKSALARARGGRYREWSFRGQWSYEREDFFEPYDEEWKLRPQLATRIRFHEVNLLLDSLPDCGRGLSDFDLILCRNVFIYFSPDAVQASLVKFRESLAPGGYFLTGHAELLGVPMEGFEIVDSPDSLYFVRTTAAPTTVKALSTGGVMCKGLKSEESRAALEAASPPDRETLYRQSARGGDYARVVDQLLAIREVRALETEEMQSLVESLVAQGDVERARTICVELSKEMPFHSTPLYLLGVLAQAESSSREAKRLLNQALYLTPDSVEVHLALAVLYETEGMVSRALKLYRQAYRLVRQLPDEQPLSLLKGQTAGMLGRELQQRVKEGGDE